MQEAAVGTGSPVNLEKKTEIVSIPHFIHCFKSIYMVVQEEMPYNSLSIYYIVVVAGARTHAEAVSWFDSSRIQKLLWFVGGVVVVDGHDLGHVHGQHVDVLRPGAAALPGVDRPERLPQIGRAHV